MKHSKQKKLSVETYRKLTGDISTPEEKVIETLNHLNNLSYILCKHISKNESKIKQKK